MVAGAGHKLTAPVFFMTGGAAGADFLDYLTKGAIIFGARIGFGLGTRSQK